MNAVTLIGRLTRDPELRYTPSGSPTVRFNIAVDRGMTKEKIQEAESKGYATADFINCIAWGRIAETIANYFDKGHRIGITGSIQTGSYERQDGTKVYTTDVLVRNVDFIDYKNTSQGANQSRPTGGNNQEDYTGDFERIDNTDDIPF